MAAHQASAGLPVSDAPGDPGWVRLVDEGDVPPHRRPRSVRYMLVNFLVANVLVAALLLVGSLWAGHRVAARESLDAVQATTDLLATSLVEPHLTDGVLTGEPAALAELDELVEDGLRQAHVVRLKIWDADARILYSDE